MPVPERFKRLVLVPPTEALTNVVPYTVWGPATTFAFEMTVDTGAPATAMSMSSPTAMMSPLPVVTARALDTGDVLSVHSWPSGEVAMEPSVATATKSALPNVTPDHGCENEVLTVHYVPSSERAMVPSEATATNPPLPPATEVHGCTGAVARAHPVVPF